MSNLPRHSSPRLLEDLKRKSRARRDALAELGEARADGQGRRNDLLPELKLVLLPVDALKPPLGRRVRKMMAAQEERIAAGVRALGWRDPVAVTGDLHVINGWERVQAAKLLGITRIPCVIHADLSPAEARELRLALNRLGELGTWDIEETAIEFDELLDLGQSLEGIGFTGQEVDQIRLGEAQALEPGTVEPDPEAKRISQIGDVWRLGRHRIACGDARDPDVYRRLLMGQAARFVFTDVPFNVHIAGHVSSSGHREFVMASGEMSAEEFAQFNLDWMAAAATTLVDGGLLATFIDWRSVEIILAAGRAVSLALLNLVIWNKTGAGMGSLWRSQHEMLPVFKAGDAKHVNNVELGRHGRHRSNVWNYPGAATMGSDAREGLKLHPTVKPVAMLVDAILDVTRKDDIVVDPFLGSGSTLIACDQTHRCCYGIELDPLYVDVVLRRWVEIMGIEPILEHREGRPDPVDGAEVDLSDRPQKRCLRIAAPSRREG